MGSRYKPRGEGGGGGRGRGAPIGADAGEVGRGGKIDWGYLQADTKQYDGRQYDLLDEDAPPAPRGGAAAGVLPFVQGCIRALPHPNGFCNDTLRAACHPQCMQVLLVDVWLQ